MKECLLDIIIENSNRRLDAEASQYAEYQQVSQVLEKKLKKLEKIKLTKKQDRAIDEALTAYNEKNACCSRIYYKQGFKDCVALLRELGMFE